MKGINSVQVSYGKKSRIGFLLAAMLFMIFGSALYMATQSLPVMFIPVVIALVFLLLYAALKQYTLTCVISTDTRVTPVVAIGMQTKSRWLGRPNNGSQAVVSIKVNKDVAKTMAEELGAVLRNAMDEL